MNKKLWRTTIELWTEGDPSRMSLEQLAKEARAGRAICTDMQSKRLPSGLCPQPRFFCPTNAANEAA